MSEHLHEQLDLGGIKVDVELSMLLQLVWKHGITTAESCQGGPEPAYVVFPLVADAAEFLLQTSHLTDYRLEDQVALTIMAPLEVTGAPRGKVSWMADHTEAISRVWMKAFS